MNIIFKFYPLLSLLLFSSVLIGQDVDFIPAGKSDGYTKYNLTVSTASGVDGSGGYTYAGTGFTAATSYYIKVSFDNGSTWYSINNATATSGTWLGTGLFTTDNNGEMQISFSHSRLTALAAWPGNDGTINLRVSNLAQDTHYPGSSGAAFTLDLTRPSISTAVIASNNSNTGYATTGDQISVTFTTSENLSTDASYDLSGDISGVSITASGSGTSWTAANTVSTHAEGAATFDITYYDANENIGASSLSATTDGSTVTIDKTAPTITTSIASDNSTTTLAKTGDVVTVSISSSEILSAAPTVTIDGNNVTPNPNTAASSYTAVRTMEAGDTQGTVAFAITNISDRAGNSASNVTAASNGTNVTFDSVAPTLTGITIASNNALSSSLAKPDDVVTLTFFTSEKAQTPTATIATEASSETNANGDQLSWTATKTMDADDANGTVAFTIDYYDLAGNQGTQATAVLSGGNVTYDRTDPAANSVVVASSNSNSSNYAMNGDVVSVTINASEDLQSNAGLSPYGISSATIAGQAISAGNISAISSTQWKVSYTMDGDESDGAASYAFTMADEAGNTETVTSAGSNVVIDNTAPTLSAVTIASNNTNDAYAKVGDVITLSITSTEDLTAAPTVFLAGRSATVNDVGGSASDYTATITGSSTDTQGAVAISIAFTDLTGNAGTTVTATTNGSSVTYDRAVPTLSAVTVTSNNDNTSYAKQGDIVTLSFTSSENVQASPTVTIDGNAATVSGSNSTWAAAYTMQSGDTEGDVNFTIDFVDISGNSGTRVTSLTSGNKIVYDETTPTLPTVDISSDNSNGATFAKVGDVITIAITASENIQTPTVTIAGNAATITSGSNGESVYEATYTMQSSDNTGTVAFTVDFSDMANNDGAQVTAVANDSDGGVTFDKQAPSFSTVTIASNNSNDATLAIVNDVITVSLTSDEAIKTGSDPAVTVNGNTATVTRNSTTSFTATYTMSSPADDAIDGSSIPINISSYTDATGNAGSAVTTTTDGSAVTFDKTLPTLGVVTIVSDNTYDHLATTGDVITLTIASSENINSPTVSMLGSTTGVTVSEGADASSWTATKTVTGGHSDGTAAFNIAFTDKAGNSGAAVTALTGGSAVTVDKSTPSITTASIASNNSSGDELAVPGNIITLTIVANENITAPTVTIATQSAAVAIGGDAQNWSATYTMTENESNGTIPFTIDYADSAGNAGGTQTSLANDVDGDEVTYDKSQPVLSNVILKSDNSFDSTYAKVGSVITVSFNSNEQLLTSSVAVTIAGVSRSPSKSASWDGTKESWVATYTMTSATDDNGGDGYSVPFTVDYVDLNGYAGDQVTTTASGTGVTFDKTAPTITTYTYTSNNSNLATRAKALDVVTVSIVASELLQTPALTVAGNAVTDETAGGTNAIWSGTYQMQNTDSDGIIGLSLDYNDYAGNAGATATATSDGGSVTFDRTAPTLTTVNLVSNNIYSNSKAKAGDVVTLTIVADENLIDSPTFTIAGNAVTPTGSGTDWSGTYTMQDGDAEGDIALTVAFFDMAANAGTNVTATTNGSAVVFDKTATDLSTLSIDLNAGSDTGAKNDDNLTNDTTPTFSISGLTAVGASGDSLFLVIGTDTVSRKIVDANSISFTSTALANQVLPYSAAVVSRDGTGNRSNPTTALKFRIDTQLPNTGNILDLLTEDDSGFLNTDDITSNTTPRLEISGLAAGKKDSLRVFYDSQTAGLNDVVIGEYRMSQAVIDTLAIGSALTDDRYTFTYFVIDSAGNTSTESASINIFIDATAPLKPNDPDLYTDWDTGTSSTDNVTNLSGISFSISNIVGGDSIFIVNAATNVVGADLSSNTSTDVSVLTANTNTYAAFAKDPAGNVSLTSGTLSVTVDQTATDVTGVAVDLHPDSDTGVANDDNITNDDTPTFTVTGLTITDSVWLYVDDVIDQRGIATSATYSFTTSSLNDNTHEIKIKAKDYAGNISDFSSSLNIRVDTTPFTLASVPDLLDTDDTGISSTDNITNKRKPSFEFSQLSSKTDSIRLFINNGISNEFIVGGRKNIDVLKDTLTIPNASRLDEGTYIFTYVVIDSAGNISTASAADTIEVDFTAPDTPNAPDLAASDDSGESDSDALTNVASMAITASGLTSGDFGLLYRVGASTTLLDSLIVPGSGSLTYTVTNSEDNTFNFYAVAQDTAGNRSANSTGKNITIDQTAPDVTGVTIDLNSASDTGIKNDDNLTNDSTPSFDVANVTVTDSVFLYFNGSDSVALKAATASVGFTGNLSTDNTYIVTMKSKDRAGNLSSASSSMSFRLDTTPFTPTSGPDLLADFDTGFDATDNITKSRVPQFVASALPSISDSLHLYVQSGITNELVFKTRKAYNVTKDTLSVPLESQLGTGDYIITYTVIDSAGNSSVASDPMTVTVDFTKPNDPGALILESASDAGETNSDKITNEDRVSITLTDILSGYIGELYFIDDPLLTMQDSSLLDPSEESLTYQVNTATTGIYQFTSAHVDTAGNRSGYGDTISIEIDHTLPSAVISFDGDSLVRAGDVSTVATFTFSESMDSVNVPRIDINYPEVASPLDLTFQPLTRASGDTIWTFEIPLNSPGLDTIDGNIELIVNASDISGNSIQPASITGLDILEVDNTAAQFSSFSPLSNSFNNILVNFGWTLDESIDTGYVTFNKLSDGSNVILPLDSLEQISGVRDPDTLSSGIPAISEGLYNVIFTGVDAAGNTGNDTIINYTYDTTSSTAVITFSQLFASAGQLDTITVTFNEKMLPSPTIQIGFPSNFESPIDTEMALVDNGDSTIWFYELTIPEGIENQGYITVGVTATDLATNSIDSADLSMPDTLFIDNTVPEATFTYLNTTNASLTNLGIGGDIIQVTVTMNEPLDATEPIPTINYIYGSGDGEDGTVVAGQVPQSTSNDDSVWVFEVTLSDSVYDDGLIDFELVAEDRSNNAVISQVNDAIFVVDNMPPADFETGLISVHGPNPVQGWITGITDTLGVQVPIQTYTEDSTLFYGGYVQMQFYNLNRGSAWVTPGPNDSLVESGPSEQFYRNIDSLYAVMPPGTDLMTGDSLSVRARIVDRHGNITNGTTSGTRLAYDPTAPVTGEVTGGNFVAGDTLFSSDQVNIQWSAFEESDEDESGLDRYEVSILKIDTSTNVGSILYGWDTLILGTTTLTQELFLEHNTPYVGHIRAFDVAGNISDTLVTDTLLRYNSNPIILSLTNAVLNEDLFWTDTVQLTDLDLSVMQGDSFTYQASTVRTIGDSAVGSISIDSIGAMTWTPTQDDTGTYNIQIIATDAYALADTFQLPLTVNAVNDTPVFVIQDPDNIKEWEEDQVESVTLNLSRYISDVDNIITTEIFWSAVILDTNQLDEDFPLGRVVIGPNTPWGVHARLSREYLGFNINEAASVGSNMSLETIQLINNSRTNPLLSVSIDVQQYEGAPDSVIATFSSDSNYYGENHRIIFIAQDLGGAEARDTVIANVTAKNDPPILSDLPDVEVVENDSIKLEFGSFTTDIDDTSLTFTITALTNEDMITINPSTLVSYNLGDSITFIPQPLFSNEAMIKVVVSDEESSDSSTFKLDILRVVRPALAVSVVQNNAFSKFLQVIITDTVSKTVNLSMEVQNQSVPLDTIAAHTYTGDLSFESSGNYSIDIYANAAVGDTTISETFALAAGRAAGRWYGSSYDGRFSVIGDPGAISYDQPFLIADSTLFESTFYDQASYVLGNESFRFNQPIEVRLVSEREDLAIYRRKNGVIWEELPSLTLDNEIFTLSEESGYFRLGPKTIIVPEQTNIHQNYPNPFNPTTTIMYDIGLLDGLSQNVTINIYNLLGQQILTLVKDQDQIGQFKVQWDGYDKFGQQMSSGVYFIQLSTKTGIVKNKKMMLMK